MPPLPSLLFISVLSIMTGTDYKIKFEILLHNDVVCAIFSLPGIINHQPFKIYLPKMKERIWKKNNIQFLTLFSFSFYFVCKTSHEMQIFHTMWKICWYHVHITWMVNVLFSILQEIWIAMLSNIPTTYVLLSPWAALQPSRQPNALVCF